MLKVYSSEDRVLIHHLKNVLQQQGIDCFLKNEMSFTLAGEVPFNEVWPELWIVNDSLGEKVAEIIEKIIRPHTTDEPWRCQQCGESHPGQFTECWKCGALKP